MVTLKQSLQEEIPFKKFGRVYTSKKKKKRNKFDSDVFSRPNEQGDIYNETLRVEMPHAKL